MVEPTHRDMNPSIPASNTESKQKIHEATSVASKALTPSAEPTFVASTQESSSSLQLPLFRDVAYSATELLAMAIQLVEETERLKEIPLKSKQMYPYELKSGVETIFKILEQSRSLVNTSLESLHLLKETLDEPSKAALGSLLNLFKSSKSER